MKVNRFASDCAVCGGPVARNAGVLEGYRGAWLVKHLACAETGQPEVIEIRTSGGTFTQNARGRCEDAPCCGCCTI